MKKAVVLEQGGIILVRFPFSNQIDYKIRPALVVSNNEHNKRFDAWVCPITTKQAIQCIPIQKFLAEGKLDRESYARTNVIASIEQEAMLKTIGKLKQEKTKEIIGQIMTNLR